MELIALAIPFFLFSIVLEAGYDYWKSSSNKGFYRINDSINDLSLGIVYQVVSILLTQTIILGLYWKVFEYFHVFELSSYDWKTWILTFFAVDFSYYVFHRCSHERNILWATHVPHHQSEEFNFSVALRQGAIEDVASIIFKLPWAIIGIPMDIFFMGVAVNTIFQFFVHTRYIKTLGIVEFIFNTPSHHRVHHACNPKYLDCNYGGMLIIWDRLFGTFVEEEEEPTFGLVSPLHSWNPIYANIHYFLHIFRYCRGTSIIEMFRIIFIKGPSDMAEIPASNIIIERPKYDPPLTGLQKIYSSLFFVIAMIVFTCMIIPTLPKDIQWFYLSYSEQLYIGILVVVLLLALGLYMEKNKIQDSKHQT